MLLRTLLASPDSIGATLEQKRLDNSIRSVDLISRATLDAEGNWTPVGLVAGAVVGTIRRMRGHVRGISQLFRQPSSGEALRNQRSATRVCSDEWSLSWRAHTYHRRGANNGNAGMLSRLPLPATDEGRMFTAASLCPTVLACT